MANLRFLWRNRFLDAATVTASSEATGYNVRNLQDPMRARRWRSTGLTTQYIQVDHLSAVPFNAIALVDHNFTYAATVALTASNTLGGTDLLNSSGNTIFPAYILASTEDRWSTMYSSGRFSESYRSYQTPNPIFLIYLGSVVTARYLKIAFTDASNPDGFFQIGRLMVGLYDDFTKNISSIRHSIVDDSDLNVSPGGQVWGAEIPPRASLDLSFEWVVYNDVYWNMLFMARKMGMTRSFVVDCFPDGGAASATGSEHWYGCMYGRFTELPRISQDGFGPFSGTQRIGMADLSIEESL